MQRSRSLVAWAAIIGLAPTNAALAQMAQVGSGLPEPGLAVPGIPSCPPPPIAVPPLVIHYAPSVTLLPGPFGPYPYAPPLIVTSGPAIPLIAAPPVVGSGPDSPFGFGPFSPVPPILPAPAPFGPIDADQGQGGASEPARPIPAIAARRAAATSNRVTELLTFGDRNFRAGDLRNAERRYRQALAAAPLSAAPRARMAQLSLVRGDYREAADRLREAITAEPTWLARAGDVQSLYAEPADFHAVLATLEAHLQAEPDDRDGWFVLGAQLYLSDRIDRAADIFLRLADRRPDATLAALMEASGVVR